MDGDKLKEVCILLNSKNEKKIQRGIKKLYRLIKKNDFKNTYNIDKNIYDVDIIIENNYLDIVIYCLSLNVEKTKSSKFGYNINLNFIEIIFYTLSWVLFHKFKDCCFFHIDNEEKKKDLEIKEKEKNFKKNISFINLGNFFYDNIHFVEIIILNNFHHNRVYILSTIFYFLLYHERFRFVFFSSTSLLVNLIKLKKNVENISDLFRKNKLNENVEEEKDKKEETIEKKKNNERIIFIRNTYEEELIYLYKFLVIQNGIKGLKNNFVDQIKNETSSYGLTSEFMLLKKNGKLKVYKEKAINEKEKYKNNHMINNKLDIKEH
ncbi:putative membrane protein, partial [Plasmodium gaboni]